MKRVLDRLTELRSRPDLSDELREQLDEAVRELRTEGARAHEPHSLSRSSAFTDVDSGHFFHEDILGNEYSPVKIEPFDGVNTTLEHIELPEITEAELVDPLPASRGPRYQDLGLVALGGMGEIRRMQDRDLNRAVVMKIIRPERRDQRIALLRFMEEAQVAAQLTHPNIPAVHELGKLSDGRLYFTMREVQGVTLEAVMTQVHSEFSGDMLQTTEKGWSMRHLVDIVGDVCSTLAFAHSRGVVHRDLKPENIMIGDFGEVQVLDWGIARVEGRASMDAEHPDAEPHDQVQVSSTRNHTLAGTVMGTAAYMAPEQVRGDIDLIGPPTDVFALGILLYQVLAGHPPFSASNMLALLDELMAGPRKPIESFAHVPEPLAAICNRALAPDPAERFEHAGQMHQAIQDWLEGIAQREKAVELIAQAEKLGAELKELEETIAWLNTRSRNQLRQVPPNAPIEQKKSAWEMQDNMQRLRRKLARGEVDYVNCLRSALSYFPGCSVSRRMLADYYYEQHKLAERLGNVEDAEEMQANLEAYDDGRHATYLRGHGRLSVTADRPDAHATLWHYQNHHRRLVPKFVCDLGALPLRDIELARGSYLLKINAPGAAEVRYPVQIERGAHWQNMPPKASEPQPIRLLEAGQLSENEVYIPAGWFWCGGGPRAPQSFDLRRVWLDGFIIQREPVTHREYLRFLNALVDAGRLDEARRYRPSVVGALVGPVAPPSYQADANGRYYLTHQTDAITLDHPVTLVNWYDARAYAQWLRDEQQLPWRLASEFEWEKAARGVDARSYPWGDFLDPTWCNMLDSHGGELSPRVTAENPEDESPYGVRGMAGNVRAWCREVYCPAEASVAAPSHVPLHDTAAAVEESPEPRVFRGGAWYFSRDQCRCAARDGSLPDAHFRSVGIRLVRPLSG